MRWAFLIVGLTACDRSPDDGVDPVANPTRLTSLDPVETSELCNDLANPTRFVDCEDGTIEVPGASATDCGLFIADLHPECAATVADYRACFEALASSDPCDPAPPPAVCDSVFDPPCAPGG